MDFGLSDEQRLLQNTFSSYLTEQVPISRARAISEAMPPDVTALWRDLANLGASGVLIPQEYGGAGLTLLDAALIAQTLGQAVVPSPYLAAAVMAPTSFLEAGSPEQKHEWLPKIASGDIRMGVAATETYSIRENACVHLESGRLRGKALMALDATEAHALLVAAGSSDLLLVSPDAPGLHISPLIAVDRTRTLSEIVFDGVKPADSLGGPRGAGSAIERMLDAGRVILAAETVGACDAMLEQAVSYASQRRQFGRVIGSFQAVKHMCAEMAAELEPARSLFWYAAHAFDERLTDSPLTIAHAKTHISEAGVFIARTATEVHGGVGFTDEQNLHIWFKRIGVNRHLLGSPDVLRERAAKLQGWATCSTP